MTNWLSSFKYKYTRKFLYQPRKWLFGQPARKRSVDPWAGWIYTIWSSMEFSRPIVVTLTLDFQVKFWKSCISGMGWPIDMELNGCESIECWTHVVAFNIHLTHDLDLGFSRSNFENALSEKRECWLTWNERGCQSMGCYTHSVTFKTWTMTFTLDFPGQILIECWTHVVTFKVHLNHDLDLGFSKWNFLIAIYRNVRAHRHRTKAIWVDRVLYLLFGL